MPMDALVSFGLRLFQATMHRVDQTASTSFCSPYPEEHRASSK